MNGLVLERNALVGSERHLESMPELRALAGADLRAALRRILRKLDAETGTVHSLRSDGMLHLAERAGAIPDRLLPVIRRIPVGKGMAGLAAERGEPVQVCNLQTDTSGDARPGARATGMRGSICVPMRRGRELVGVLGVAVSGEREFSAEESGWLSQAGAALADGLRWRSCRSS